MLVKIYFVVIVVLITYIVEAKKKPCFKDDTEVPAGNQGQSPLFPWLGLLRVHIHEDIDVVSIAVTGVVLIKEMFAIGIAKDISKIPRYKLIEYGNVMFIVEKNDLWFCKVKDYYAHPDTEKTMNTIGIVELYPQKRGDPFKAVPICWPDTNFNASDQLYLVQYVDDNKVLEKNVINLQYLDRETCDEFYQRQMEEDTGKPLSYQCTFALNDTNYCVWENGNIMASNASDYWVLIGLGIHGPGCSAPNRFILTLDYLPWIEATTFKESDLSLEDDIIVEPPSPFQK